MININLLIFADLEPKVTMKLLKPGFLLIVAVNLFSPISALHAHFGLRIRGANLPGDGVYDTK